MSLPLLTYYGPWYSVSNTPSLADGVGTLGESYIIINSSPYPIGSTFEPAPDVYNVYDRDLGSGSKSWLANFYIYYDGAEWQMIGGATGGSGTTPNLQQVTDVGSITTNTMTVGSLSGLFSQILNSAVGTQNASTGTYAYIDASGYLGLNNGLVESYLYNTNVTNAGISLEFPNTSGSTSHTIPISVNGVSADSAGNIAISGGTGTVTSVGTTGLISGGPITTTGTITTSMSTNKLVGRSTAGTGIMEEITVGSGLTLSGGTLTASGSGSGSAYEQQFLLMGA